jgi:S-DNA-T family DNA segregation ATPase FtsK/SpoIIIE
MTRLHTSSPSFSRAKSLLSEAALVLNGALLLALTLFLVTYHPSDPSWSHAVQATQIHNAGGQLGAWFSDLLLFIFGLSAYWWCVLLLHHVFTRWKRIRQHPHDRYPLLNWLGFLLVLSTSAGLESMRTHTLPVALPSVPGGIFGQYLSQHMQAFIGVTGSALVLLTFLTIGLSWFFQFSWLNFIEKLGATVEKSYLYLQNYVESKRDRELGKQASANRAELVIEQRHKTDDMPSIQIVRPTVVPRHEKVEMEKQTVLFDDIQQTTTLPPFSLLDPNSAPQHTISAQTVEFTSRLIEKKLRDFGVIAQIVAAHPGPVVTRYELEPATGVKGSQIVNLAKDLARSLSLISIRVVETIPGKATMGLELPNAQRQTVRLSEILGSQVFNDSASLLTLALGKDIAGKPIIADLAKMPHCLVAGTTGSGKSVGINAMILSLLYKATPEQVRLIMIDPKMLELAIYEGIPHLLCPVVTDMRQAAAALNWAVAEMERRYKLMSQLGVRNLTGYNKKIEEAAARNESIKNPFSLTPDDPEPLDTFPLIVILIDELADLMMVAGKKIEELIARIAQKARAAGIHLILATQRPSVDVITGLIKANVPTRISFQVSSKIDSRTILDQAGAETLLGMGDMLFLAPGTGLPIRVHGAFVADEEVHRVVEHLRAQAAPNYIDGILDSEEETGDIQLNASNGENDPLYDQAVEIVLKHRRASISLVQRHLRIGYNRAARLLEQMERSGLVSGMASNGNREILVPHKEA